MAVTFDETNFVVFGNPMVLSSYDVSGNEDEVIAPGKSFSVTIEACGKVVVVLGVSLVLTDDVKVIVSVEVSKNKIQVLIKNRINVHFLNKSLCFWRYEKLIPEKIIQIFDNSVMNK